jgi:hypothetical protein
MNLRSKIFAFFKIIVAAAELAKTLTSLLVPYSSSTDPDRRVAQYSPRYRLAFSLLNEDAAVGGAVLRWNIQRGLKGTHFIVHFFSGFESINSTYYTYPWLSSHSA